MQVIFVRLMILFAGGGTCSADIQHSDDLQQHVPSAAGDNEYVQKND